jgi:hypothetical protein
VRIGDLVEITDGPLFGLQARFVRTTKKRVLLVVELQGREFNVEMDLGWIVAASARRPLSGIEAPEIRRKSSSA